MSIIPTTYNLKVYQGQSVDKAFVLKDDAGIPVDITGYEIFASLADKDGKILYERGYIQHYSQGSFYWGFTKEQIGGLTPGTYLFDLVMYYPNGRSDVFLRGPSWQIIAGATI